MQMSPRRAQPLLINGRAPPPPNEDDNGTGDVENRGQKALAGSRQMRGGLKGGWSKRAKTQPPPRVSDAAAGQAYREALGMDMLAASSALLHS